MLRKTGGIANSATCTSKLYMIDHEVIPWQAIGGRRLGRVISASAPLDWPDTLQLGENGLRRDRPAQESAQQLCGVDGRAELQQLRRAPGIPLRIALIERADAVTDALPNVDRQYRAQSVVAHVARPAHQLDAQRPP